MDGQEVAKVENDNPMEYHNVDVKASYVPDYRIPNVYVKNLKWTN